MWFDLILIWQHVYMSYGDIRRAVVWVSLSFERACVCVSYFTACTMYMHSQPASVCVVCKMTCIRTCTQTHTVITIFSLTVLHSNSLTQKHVQQQHSHRYVQCFQSNLKRVWNDCHIRFSISIAWFRSVRLNEKIHLALGRLNKRWRWLTSNSIFQNTPIHFNAFWKYFTHFLYLQVIVFSLQWHQDEFRRRQWADLKAFLPASKNISSKEIIKKSFCFVFDLKKILLKKIIWSFSIENKMNASEVMERSLNLLQTDECVQMMKLKIHFAAVNQNILTFGVFWHSPYSALHDILKLLEWAKVSWAIIRFLFEILEIIRISWGFLSWYTSQTSLELQEEKPIFKNAWKIIWNP